MNIKRKKTVEKGDHRPMESLLKKNLFWSHPRVKVTAQCSAFSPENQVKGDGVFLENIEFYMSGGSLSFEVDKSEFQF